MDTSEDPSSRIPSPALLDQRIVAQSVMSKLLEVLAQEPPRSRLGRFFGAGPLSDDSRPWYQGAVGEIEVGRLLARLGPDWTVLHAVPVGAGEADIDHVVIGAAGVFTINTKHHADKSVWIAGRTLMVSGQKQRYIPNSIHEAGRAGKLLSAAAEFTVPVEALIVLVGAKKVVVKERPSGAAVMEAPQLLRWLGKRPVTLTDGAVARIVAAANRPETWHRAPADADKPAEIKNGFNQVQKSVKAARHRRRIWGFTGMVAVAALAFIGYITLAPAVLDSVLQMISH